MAVEKSRQQKNTPEKLPLRAKIPSPSIGLNKRVILLSSSILSVFTGIVIINALSAEKT